MKADARRYMPILESLEHLDSLYEIKTLQIQNEIEMTDQLSLLKTMD